MTKMTKKHAREIAFELYESRVDTEDLDYDLYDNPKLPNIFYAFPCNNNLLSVCEIDTNTGSVTHITDDAFVKICAVFDIQVC